MFSQAYRTRIQFLIRRFLDCCFALGPINGARLGLAHRLAGSWKVKPKFGDLPRVRVRGNTSDPDVFFKIFVSREYPILDDAEISLVIDGGANVGCSALYFSEAYPSAKIIAIEPEATNFELLCQNTEHVSRIECVHAAIWPKQVPLRIKDTDSSKWAMQTVEGEGPDSIPGTTIDQLLEEHFKGGHCLVKLDIEGAEGPLFSQAPQWINRVHYLQLEFHDTWKPVFDALSQIEYRGSLYGENVCLQLFPEATGPSGDRGTP